VIRFQRSYRLQSVKHRRLPCRPALNRFGQVHARNGARVEVVVVVSDNDLDVTYILVLLKSPYRMAQDGFAADFLVLLWDFPANTHAGTCCNDDYGCGHEFNIPVGRLNCGRSSIRLIALRASVGRGNIAIAMSQPDASVPQN